ncbi:MAG: type I methionyl aminopeptidase [Gemmatimonadetes bacterium]|uniref:Methionine aminopeptidase n=1 Tax=Candidatus Kutchimonas denitrificans TaxID=3056748 RepID=A0AAE4Z4Y0_9BACT|nr:type I methionyl aminopeptidase [Gemmatimonadota bacterium]NIR73869.1 type I methionyl aminopeptidase [Candidatus Kutchimonas denitrificans]NIR99675.1 type I methionyl aminopeptidase [Gemmatimonadota bacterium]NIT65260.1 type I methionyl aminopeptidase [Gemmatimonadota bacterium]NIW73709.1 type I methionyl aminopeptidase [Gemmatimonadota bacterium]
MITLKTDEEIELIARASEIVADVLDQLEDRVRPGVSTGALDEWAEGLIRSYDDATPAFKGLYGFPATLCTSVNHEVVHGIPSRDRILEDGDIVSVDVGVCYEGYYGDGAVTLPVGTVAPPVGRLLTVTREALTRGVESARPGGRLGDISAAIEAAGAEAGYSVVRELVGHGIGARPHEEPQVPNYGRAGEGLKLQPGLVLAIEPMFNLGGREIRTLADDWTVVTADGQVSAHFEHTVAITREGPRILTVVPSKAG